MLGAIIGAGASLLGGILGKKSEDKSVEKTNATNMAINDKNIALQKEFAQSGIQWKVNDAKAAGVHPLAALGAQTHPGGTSLIGAVPSRGGAHLAAAGQDIGRAIAATDSQGGANAALQQLQLENMGLQNDVLREQITASRLATIRQSALVPMPSAGERMLVDGQSSSGLVKTSPMARQSVAPGKPHQEAGAVSDTGYTRTTDGYMPTMSKDAKDRLDDDTIGMLSWNLRNRILPSIGLNQTPPDAPLPEGYDAWIYNPFTQQYTPHKRGLFGIYY